MDHGWVLRTNVAPLPSKWNHRSGRPRKLGSGELTPMSLHSTLVWQLPIIEHIIARYGRHSWKWQRLLDKPHDDEYVVQLVWYILNQDSQRIVLLEKVSFQTTPKLSFGDGRCVQIFQKTVHSSLTISYTVSTISTLLHICVTYTPLHYQRVTDCGCPQQLFPSCRFQNQSTADPMH